MLIAGAGVAALTGIGVAAVLLASIGAGPPVSSLADPAAESRSADGVSADVAGESAAVGELGIGEPAQSDLELVPATELAIAFAPAQGKPGETISRQPDDRRVNGRTATAVTNGSAKSDLLPLPVRPPVPMASVSEAEAALTALRREVEERSIGRPTAAFGAVEEAEDVQPAPAPAAVDETDAPSRLERVTTDVNMRAGPDNSAPVLAVVRAGSRVEVIDCNYWCEVMFAGKRGWIYKGFIAGRS